MFRHCPNETQFFIWTVRQQKRTEISQFNKYLKFNETYIENFRTFHSVSLTLKKRNKIFINHLNAALNNLVKSNNIQNIKFKSALAPRLQHLCEAMPDYT